MAIEADNINVLELITVKQPERKHCQHIRIALDVQRRLIECQDCNQFLDPFDYLVHYGNRFLHYAKRVGDQRRQELESICNEIEKLKRERNNLKAQIKRCSVKMNPKEEKADNANG